MNITTTSQEEIWKDIEDFPGYEVSNLGNVRSWLRRGVSNELRVEPLILSPGTSGNGYKLVVLTAEGVPYTRMVHQIVAGAFIGERPPGHVTRHLDGNKHNNTAENLAYGTHSDNRHDAVRHGYKHKKKLTYQLAEEIRKLYKTGEYSQRVLGEKFGVDQSHVANILAGRAWSVAA